MTLLQEWMSVPRMRASLGALVLACALLVYTGVHAVSAHPVAATPSTVQVVAGALDAPVDPPAVNVPAAVAQGLFSPDRTAPEARYRMPGEAAAAAKPAAEKPAEPLVLGTAIAADGTSFATVQLQSPRLVMMHVGDKIGDYVVKSIERGKVVFTTAAGKPLEVLALKPGS